VHVIEALFAERACSGGLSWQSLLQKEAPRPHDPVGGSTLRVSYLGHAGLLMETADMTVLVDPVIPSRDGINDEAILSFSELPPHISVVCLTHAHMDHTCLETLLQLRHRIGRVLVPKSGAGELADPSLKLMLRELGFDAQEMDDMETLPCASGHIRAIPFLGEHADLRIRAKSAWLIELRGRRILAGADAAGLDGALYRRVAECTGKLDLLFIGMECVGAPMSWLYGSLFTKPIPKAINDSRRFNGSDSKAAWQLVQCFEPDEVGLYALGTESWFRYFMGIHYEENSHQMAECERLVSLCQTRGIAARRLAGKQFWTFLC
jgi:L-ascorbate metabolism protein UlaG (beta-lactamase superfamily)